MSVHSLILKHEVGSNARDPNIGILIFCISVIIYSFSLDSGSEIICQPQEMEVFHSQKMGIRG